MSLAKPLFHFGPWPIGSSEVFFTSRLSYGLVNLKPVVPGHVLVIPRRLVPRFTELSPEEVSDLWLAAQRIGAVIEKEYKAESLTLTIQDGPAAGQTVPHVHIHVIPRVKGDWMDNDQIYPAINGAEKVMAEGLENKKKHHGPDLGEERRPRTMEEMAVESQKLRSLLTSYEDV